jgi:hypothetical protein
MQTLPPPNPLATHQPSSRQPERRMARNRRPESGERKQSLDCPLALLGPLCVALRGRIGNRVYKTYGDKIIVTRVPRFDGYKPSDGQRELRNRMRAATAFAQAVYSDPAAKAVYVSAAKALGRQPFRLAVSDFLLGRTRISPSVQCPATSPATPNDRAQGSHAAGVQRPGSPELSGLNNPDPGCTCSTISKGESRSCGFSSLTSTRASRIWVSMTRTPPLSRRASIGSHQGWSTDAKRKRCRERALWRATHDRLRRLNI